MKCIPVAFLFFISPVVVKSQGPPVELHTIFTCIDSVTYTQLFNNTFIKDSLFLCRELSTTTTAESYTGKYFIGASATLEFFAPSPTGAIGDQFADLGIEIRTGKLNDQRYYLQKAKRSNIAFQMDTTKLEDSVKPLLFYTDFKIKDTAVTNRFAISLIEYQKEYLAAYGLNNAAINRFMNNKELNEQLHGGKKYPRLFSGVTKIVLQLNETAYQYLKKTMDLMGYIQRGNVFTGHGLTIEYSIKENAPFRLSSISVSLLQALPQRKIMISNKLHFEINGKAGQFDFLY